MVLRLKKGAKTRSESVYVHPALGEVRVCRNARARRISLSVRPLSKIRLTIPAHVALDEGLRFLAGKEEWVKRALDRQAEKYRPVVIVPPYSTRSHHLRLAPMPLATTRISLSDSEITVRYPSAVGADTPEVQKAIRRGIEEAWRAEAREMLPQRVERLAAALGFRYRSVTVRNTVSKWGSCSPANDLSLSLHLMRLPDRLIDYVLTHELCHTVHKNHGPAFHALLDRCTGGRHPALRRELRTYDTRW